MTIEGPLCRDSKVVGWFTKDTSVGTTKTVSYAGGVAANSNAATGSGPRSVTRQRPNPIDASGFAFNSSILWDPERWGRPTSLPDTSQVSLVTFFIFLLLLIIIIFLHSFLQRTSFYSSISLNYFVDRTIIIKKLSIQVAPRGINIWRNCVY